MKAKYDKSKVMKRAWYIFRHSFVSFADALRESWKRIKEEVTAQVEVAEKSAEYQRKNKAYNDRINRVYSGCWYGRNDWERDFRNDAKKAIKRSQELNLLKS